MFSGTVPYPKRKRQPEDGFAADSTSTGPTTKQHLTIDDIHIVTGGSKERLASATALHGETFKTDPAINFMLHDWARDARIAYIPEYLHTLLGAAALNGAIFDESWMTEPPNDSTSAPACSAVWLPPGHKIDNWRTYTSLGMWQMLRKVGVSGIMRALGDFQSFANKAKKKGLSKPDGSGQLVPFYYLFFISTAVAARGLGMASKVVGRFQDELRKEGKNFPIWLEATTEKSMQLYARLGFEHVDSWILGRRQVDMDGEQRKGGEGVTIWGMVWWPQREAKNSSAGAAPTLSEALFPR